MKKKTVRDRVLEALRILNKRRRSEEGELLRDLNRIRNQLVIVARELKEEKEEKDG